MAYRTFENQPYYEAPEIGDFPNNTMRALQTAVEAKRRRLEQNKMLAGNYQADKLASSFTNDQEDLNRLSQDNTKEAVNDLMNYGRISPKTRERLQHAQGFKQVSDAQWKMKEDMEKNIQKRASQDKYYIPSADHQKVIEASYGKDGERINWERRGENLNKVANEIGNDYINTFDKEGYLNDFVKSKKESSIGSTFTSQTDQKTGKKVQAIFWDKNGVPGVTDEHAIEVLNSSPAIQKRYDQEVDLSLMDDAKKMAATKEGAWLKDMTPAQQVQALRDNPSLNTERKETPGDLARQLAKKDLESKQRTILNNSYDAGSLKGDEQRKGVTSTTYGVDPAFWTTAFGGAGSKLVSKKGTPFKITLKGAAMDANEGKMTGNNYSTRDMVVDGYNLSLIDKKTGKPINVQVKSPEEYVQFIKELRPDQVAQYELKPVIHGQAFNRADVISNARRERDKLIVQPNKTEAEQANLASLESVLKMSDLNPDLAPEVFQAALKNVIPNVAEDLMKVVNPKDPEVSEIKTKLGNFDITSPKNWSSDEQMVANAWQERVNSLGHVVESPTTPVKKGKITPTVKMITVITPDGQEGQIPEGKWAEAEKRGFKKK